MRNAIAIDLGGTNIRAARIDEQGRILAREKAPTRPAEGFERIIERIAGLARALQDVRTIGLGLGTPGTPDPEHGIMRSPAVNIPNSLGFPLGPRLNQATGLPILLDNDGNLAALGEAWQGAAREAQIVLLLAFGTGIGGGLVIGGEVFHGATNSTEFGHICIEVDGRSCACGGVGCYEAYASAAALGRDARQALEAGSPEARASQLWQRCDGDPARADAKLLCEAARGGDPFAGALLDRGCEYLAAGMGALINALNPHCVVFGGGLSLAGEFLLGKVRAALARGRAYRPIWEACRLVPASLGDDAGLVGAARLVFQRQAGGH